MGYCAHCKQKTPDAVCPVCGGDAERPVVLNQGIQIFIWPLFGGLVGLLAAAHFYRPLDSERLMLWGIVVFFLPFAVHLTALFRKRLARSIAQVRSFYLVCGLVLLVMAGATALNGALDSAPARLVQTAVEQKSITSGRYSTSYLVWVPCLRPGRKKERLEVSRDLYYSLHTGQSIVVPLHRGALGLPWYGQVSPAN